MPRRMSRSERASAIMMLGVLLAASVLQLALAQFALTWPFLALAGALASGGAYVVFRTRRSLVAANIVVTGLVMVPLILWLGILLARALASRSVPLRLLSLLIANAIGGSLLFAFGMMMTVLLWLAIGFRRGS